MNVHQASPTVDINFCMLGKLLCKIKINIHQRTKYICSPQIDFSKELGFCEGYNPPPVSDKIPQTDHCGCEFRFRLPYVS